MVCSVPGLNAWRHELLVMYPLPPAPESGPGASRLTPAAALTMSWNGDSLIFTLTGLWPPRGGTMPSALFCDFWQRSTWHIAVVQESWQDGWMTVIRTGRLQWRAYPACAVYSGILGLVQVCSQSIGKPFLCHKVGWIKQWKQEQRMQEEIGRDS